MPFRNSSRQIPDRFRSFSWSLLCLAMLLSVNVGCRSNRVQWNLFNWQNLDRVPPPATGTLSIPGVQSTYPTTTLPPPPSTLPPGNYLPQVNPGSYYGNPPAGSNLGNPTGAMNPGVYFNQPGVTGNTGAWLNANASDPNAALNAIPGREASSGMGLPTAAMQNNGMSSNGNLPGTVPPLLTGENFDPFSTSRIPSWNPQIGSAPSTNPLMVTSQPSMPTGNSPVGWWPDQNPAYSNVPSVGNNNANALGNGQVIRNMQQSMTQFFQQQPANVGGFQTTAPIENPMILATGYQGQQPVAAPPVTSGGPVAANPADLAQQWAAYQQQQMDALRVQQMQQLQAVTAANPSAIPSASGFQVLAESTTSRIAENQSRQGIRTATNVGDPRYTGQQPQGSALAVPR